MSPDELGAAFRAFAHTWSGPSLLVHGHEVIEANEAAVAYLGRDLAGVRLDAVFEDDDRMAAFLRASRRSREAVLGALKLLGGNGDLARCEGFLVQPASEDASTVVLVRLRVREHVRSQFAALTEQVESLQAEIRRRRRAERRLRESEERYRRLIETAQEGIWSTDAEGRTVFANQRLAEMLGCERESLLGRHFSDFVFDADRAQADDGFRRVRAGEAVQIERRYRRADGTALWSITSASPLLAPDGSFEGVVAMLTDVTERHEADARIARYAAELERSNQELEQFAYIASHDLQEPLRKVKSYTELLARRYEGQLDERADTFIRYAVDGAERMHAMIQDLLAYSRAGRAEGELLRVDVGAVLERVLDDLEYHIEQAGARVDVDPLPPVLAHPVPVAQLLQNLLTNAIKFRKPGTPPHVRVSAEPHDDGWCFAVADDGIGMDPAQAERVFQVFYRLNARHEYPGTGIGLAVCKKVVERFGGRIWVEAAPGEGTTFYFTLPALPGAAASDAATPQGASGTAGEQSHV